VPKKVFAGNFTALFYFKKSAAEAHRILVERPCSVGNNMRDWFRRSKNNDIHVEDKIKNALARRKSLKSKNWITS